MEDTGKAPESDFAGSIAGELRAFLGLSDDEYGSEFLPDVPIKEELVEEVMQQLWKEINCRQGTDSDTNTSSSSSSPEGLPGFSSSFAAIGGNKESCGPSFSDSASTMMVGIEVGGGASSCGGGSSCSVGPTVEASGGHMGLPAAAGNGRWVVVEERGGGGCAEGGKVMGERMDGYDGKEIDDEWLTRVLSWGPQELDEWI